MTLHSAYHPIQFPAYVSQTMPHRVAVAWSGGADSTALLLDLYHKGYDVQAWHVDHGWHQDSINVGKALQTQAEHLGIPFHIKSIIKPSRNLEAESRQGRYAAFETLASETGCLHLALAHHANDQAETVCMRLLQGAGVAGCQGIKVQRQQGDLNIWRPYLHTSKEYIAHMLDAHQATWVEDPSNVDTRLWRNKIRKKLFPMMQKHDVNPHALFLRWQAQAVRVQQNIETLAQTTVIQKKIAYDTAYCVVDWQIWSTQLAPVRAYVLQQMIALLFADGRVFGRRHILAIEAWRKHGGHNWLNLSRCCLYRQGKDLQLCQGKASLRHRFKNK